ncbi:spermidine synthase [Shewanella acanthi]|uniref:spermidine synthase n=1 Tax=Shewanella acanthi TaxID=2864212 RepID=UPI001C657551|nr:methyltransferase domain-containing protein [Shewanella acanthi]QYJ78210.1 methyltransferase domain-containing protein [Shewanella acanthi]
MTDATLLHETQDEYGVIRVLDYGESRVLSFGDNDEQSKILKTSPHVPQHTYVQAMLLVLLFCKPKSAIVLGLGGGALIHALRNFDAAIKLTAVELRPVVIELAKRYFQLPIGKKLNLINGNAITFLENPDHKKVDVIFADIYSAKGVDSAQLSPSFLENCTKLIKPNGYLVLNCWKEHSQNRELLEDLKQHFAHIDACLTSGGNWVIFASQTSQILGDSSLKNQAQALSQQLDFALERSLNRFGPWV